MKPATLLLVSIFVAPFLSLQSHSAVWFVDSSGSLTNSGQSWSSPFSSVTRALSTSQSGDEVWVKEGVYFENLTLGPGTALYGGFQGIESRRDQRDWVNHLTVLDGRQQGSVIQVARNSDTNTQVNGFTIRNGWALNGGGIAATNAFVSLANNRFLANRAATNPAAFQGGGGAVYLNGPGLAPSPSILSNWFEGNSAPKGLGGALRLLNLTDGSLRIVGNIFKDNTANADAAIGLDLCVGVIEDNLFIRNLGDADGVGGAVECYQSAMAVRRNRFIQNRGGTGSGAVFCFGQRKGINTVLARNLFLLNSEIQPEFVGAAVGAFGGASIELYNNTLIANYAGPLTASSQAGAVGSDGSQAVAATNNIFVRHRSALNRPVTSNMHLGYNLFFQNGDEATSLAKFLGTNGNFAADPRFGEFLPGLNARLQPDSPARNAGVPINNPDAGYFDLDGHYVGQDGASDLGAYQSDGTAIPPVPHIQVFLSPSGDDSLDGASRDTAKLTLTNAFSLATVDSVLDIELAPGQYDGGILAPPFLMLHGQGANPNPVASPPAAAILGKTNSAALILDGTGPFVQIANLTLTAGFAGLIGTNASPMVSDCAISNNGRESLSGAGILLRGSPIISNCVVAGNVAQTTPVISIATADPGAKIVRNSMLGNAGASLISITGQGSVQNNWIASNRVTVANGSAISLSDFLAPTNWPFIGNTIVSNIVNGGFTIRSTSFDWFNNLIAFNQGDIVPSIGGNFRNNCVFGNGPDNLTNSALAAMNLIADPLLLPDGLHLSSNSPCRDAGLLIISALAQPDIDGQPRLMGLLPDIGADESLSPSADPDVLKAQYQFETVGDLTYWLYSFDCLSGCTLQVTATAPVVVSNAVRTDILITRSGSDICPDVCYRTNAVLVLGRLDPGNYFLQVGDGHELVETIPFTVAGQTGDTLTIHSEGASLTLHVDGIDAVTYTLEASEDLVTWAPQTQHVGAPFDYTAPFGPNHQFFRVKAE